MYIGSNRRNALAQWNKIVKGNPRVVNVETMLAAIEKLMNSKYDLRKKPVE